MYDARLLLLSEEEQKKKDGDVETYETVDDMASELAMLIKKMKKGEIETSESEKEDLFNLILAETIDTLAMIKDQDTLRIVQRYLVPAMEFFVKHNAEMGVAIPNELLENIIK